MGYYIPGTGVGEGGGSIARDMYFENNSQRNTFTANNPNRIYQGVTCAVEAGGPDYDYYQWDESGTQWRNANLIYQGGQGEQGESVTGATIDSNGDLVLTMSDGSTLDAGRAKGEDGDLVYQLLPMADYGNFFDSDWSSLGTNIYGLTGDGANFANTPFSTVAGQEYSYEILLVNEANQYSMRITLMEAGNNSGRDAILAGTSKANAEAAGWKVYAFTSDPGHADPKEGFDLNPNADIGLDSTSAITIKNNAGDTHNAIDQDTNLDAIRLGSPVMPTYLRTGTERMQIQTTNGMKDIAHLEDIAPQTNPDRLAYWVREQSYVLSADDIGKEITLAVQPQAVVNGTREVTITFPNQAAFTDHYYIPDVSPAGDEAIKPHIETFRFSLWAYYFQASPVKITMLSDGNWLPFVSSESLSEENGVYLYRESEQDANELHTFAFMRPINHNPAVGAQGWVLQNVHPYSWLPLTSQPPSSPPISTLGTFLINDEESNHLRTGTGIQSVFDANTGEHTLTVDPTNIDLSGYAELEADVSFSKVSVKNATDPLYESLINVTNGGNTELNLVGTINLRKVDKASGLTTDVLNINGSTGAVDLRTDVTYQGAINADDSLVNRLYVDGMTYYKGQGLGIPASTTISTNTVEQNTPVAYFENSLSHDSETIITIDESLVASETIIKVSGLAQYSSKTFLLYHGATDNGEKTIRRGETWRIRLDASGSNHWVYERVDDGTRVTRGLGGRLTTVEHPHVGLFQYAENMPYHLLIETPTSSRLVHEFPREKTFRFTPISTGREHDNNVVINQANQGVATADLALGQYSDLPLYVIEPNVVVNRDQRAWINFPANMTLDVSAGFYAFGTVSGWCGNNTSEGNVAVYVGSSENFRTYTQNIGFVLGNSGVFLLDGQNLRTAQNSAALQFNIEPGVTHMIRYAFYVDATGLMTYYIVDLNTGQVSTGTQQCNLASLGGNPKIYVSYDRFGNNTSAIAIAETHLVVNSVGDGEGRWNWRN